MALKKPDPNTQAVRDIILPLLLSCKALSRVTSRVVFTRSQFHTTDYNALEWFLQSLERSGQLSQVKHVSITFYNDEDIEAPDDEPEEVADRETRVIVPVPIGQRKLAGGD